VGERIADARPHAEEARELRGEARKLGGPAGEDDLADAERARLALVELERGDELAGELVNVAGDRLAHLLRLFGREPGRDRRVSEGERELDRLGLRG
jgi:hypothetical protein